MFPIRKIFLLCFMLGLFASVTSSLRAQTAQGRISGAVTDPAKAVIPGVTVKVINEATGLETHAISNEVGRYVIPS